MSDPQLWNDVDGYLTGLLAPEDDALSAALSDSDDAGLPHINVAPHQGKLLPLMAGNQGATRILEIGPLGGYSPIWLGRALPADGAMVSLEYEPRHADVARGNLAPAGLDNILQVRGGAAPRS